MSFVVSLWHKGVSNTSDLISDLEWTSLPWGPTLRRTGQTRVVQGSVKILHRLCYCTSHYPVRELQHSRSQNVNCSERCLNYCVWDLMIIFDWSSPACRGAGRSGSAQDFRVFGLNTSAEALAILLMFVPFRLLSFSLCPSCSPPTMINPRK